jgi:excisionase family DNA binding protein
MNSVENSFSLSVIEVSKTTSLGKTTIYSALKSGALKSRKIGKRRIILTEDLKDWLRNAAPMGS